MKKVTFFMLFSTLLLIPAMIFATGITSRPITPVSDELVPCDAVPYLRNNHESTPVVDSPEMMLEDVLDEKSIRTVFLPGDKVYFRVDAFSDEITLIDTRDSLPDACYDAINASPRWLRLDLYQSFRHLPSGTSESIANLILTSPVEQIDEIAFCAAHMSPQSLTDSRFDTELLQVNAEWIYLLDDSLDFVELVEYGDDDDWFTTTAYRVVNPTLEDTTILEIPSETYYWYVVHPKLSDEAPKMRDSDTETYERTYGYFWREFLWNDPDPSHNYSDSETFPKLSEWIMLAQILWIRNDTSFAADREISSENSALDILGEWVSTILPFPPSGIRSIQPNQLAVRHRGYCGECQDLLAAAQRTALIPSGCVGMLLQDHVWNEFWDNGYPGEYWTEDAWHTYQVDRVGGGTALAPFWGGYDADRGGSKSANNAITYRGDSYMVDRTPAYTQVCTLIVEVLDNLDNPVPGAEVWFISNSLYNPDSLYTADVRVTDSDGRVVLSMGEDCPYFFQVSSALGYYPPGGGIASFPELDTAYAEPGQTYIASINLSSALWNFPITELPAATGEKQLHVSFHAESEYIRGSGVFDGQDGTYSNRMDDGSMSVFVCDSANFALYNIGLSFEAYEYHSRVNENWFIIDLPDDDIWYAVASTQELLNNDNLIYFHTKLGYDIEDIAENIKPEKPILSTSPNPFNSACEIGIDGDFKRGELKIIDIAGKVVENIRVQSGQNLIWRGGVSSGIYTVKLVTDNCSVEKKIVFLK